MPVEVAGDHALAGGRGVPLDARVGAPAAGGPGLLGGLRRQRGRRRPERGRPRGRRGPAGPRAAGAQDRERGPRAARPAAHAGRGEAVDEPGDLLHDEGPVAGPVAVGVGLSTRRPRGAQGPRARTSRRAPKGPRAARGVGGGSAPGRGPVRT